MRNGLNLPVEYFHQRGIRMILKSADNKSKRLQLLEELQQSDQLDDFQRKWLRQQLPRERKGIQGEKDAAFFLDQYFKDGKNHVVMHDLRFVVDGDVAQIDHLIINRGFGMYLIETKNYKGNLLINEHGEFTVEYDNGDRYGIPSPLEQSKRHERILHRVLERLDIKSRTGGPMDLFHVVMVHPQALITRPPAKMFDTSNVIKADQFPSWHGQFVDKEMGVSTVLKVVANVRSLDTIKGWGEKLVRQHRPANQLDLPEFMQPKKPAPADSRSAPSVLNAETAKVPQAPTNAASGPSQPRVAGAAGTSVVSPAPEKRLICAQCGVKISYPEGKFCWNNSRRFGGLQYCREHQGNF
jgi:hypothetical protein